MITLNSYMRILAILLIFTGILLGACQSKNSQPSAESVNNVLDDWHKAAANGDFERYFNHFENDSSIFMGTDATERWTISEFKPWSRPYFEDDGIAWTFTPTFRKIYFSDN